MQINFGTRNEIFMVVAPVVGVDRGDLEDLEGNHFSAKEIKEHPLLSILDLFPISDFTTLCNDECFDPADKWVGYIYVTS